MKKAAFLSTIVMAVLAMVPVTSAQAPSAAPAAQTTGRGNSDLLASNTVRAVFRGMQEVAVSRFTNPQSYSTQVAVFEVVENLAHRRLVRYGDGLLQAGTIITVSMDRNQPGQPSSVVDEIAQMQVGEEAVMKIDHLFLFAEPEGINIRPCTRLARKPAGAGKPQVSPVTPVTPAAPISPVTPVTPAVPAVPARPVTPVITPGTGAGQLMGGANDDTDTIVE